MFYIRIFNEIRKCLSYVIKGKLKIQNLVYNTVPLKKWMCVTHRHTHAYIEKRLELEKLVAR